MSNTTCEGKIELLNELSKIISSSIHNAKSNADLNNVQWKIIDSQKIAEEALKKIIKVVEQWLFLPCCHVSGIHDPNHFTDRQYICESQKAKAFERFCQDLGVNPVTRSKTDCGWCSDYLHYRKGEGLPLFKEDKKQ